MRAAQPGERRDNVGGHTNVKINGIHGLAEGVGDEGYSRMGACIRKYVQAEGTNARVFFTNYQPWKVFRYGEILLNWAEAAYELGLITGNDDLKAEAFEYINEIRERAGAHPHAMVTNPADIGSEIYGFPIDENLQYIRDERARELVFENHRVFDIRRWRVADIMFMDGVYTHGLLPYQVLDEINPDWKEGDDPDKKYMWIFLPEVEREGRRVNFNKKDYYDQIPGGEINKNPSLVRNDGH